MFEMRQSSINVIGDKRATGTTRLPTRPEHEVIHNELTAPIEKFGQTLLPRGSVEHVLLLNLHPRQCQTLGVDLVAQMCRFFFLQQQRLSRHQPLFLRYHWMLLHVFPPWSWTRPPIRRPQAFRASQTCKGYRRPRRIPLLSIPFQLSSNLFKAPSQKGETHECSKNLSFIIRSNCIRRPHFRDWRQPHICKRKGRKPFTRCHHTHRRPDPKGGLRGESRSPEDPLRRSLAHSGRQQARFARALLARVCFMASRVQWLQ